MSNKVIFLQLNELNFDYLSKYIELGQLPNFSRFFKDHGYIETTSEDKHELANPWIQWPTVHTGLDYRDHGVFRLGDIVNTEHPHIYEVLENHGVKVAAISPFNARNNTSNAAFFVPDPWTKTKFVGSSSLRLLYEGLCDVTDDYANGKISLRAMLRLLIGSLTHIRWKTLPRYIAEASAYAFTKNVWYRAIVCDRLLFDTFVKEWKAHKPGFATLFLNGGAHLQHHYLFSSAAYPGMRRNPTWHVAKGEDPLLDILKVYDELLGALQESVGDTRILIATGLHQDPHERTTFYYRLDDHVSLLRQMGLEYSNTYRLMTEDFVVNFGSDALAAAAQAKIEDVRTVDREDVFYVETADRASRTNRTGSQIFHVENRGASLYVQLKPTAIEMPDDVAIRCGDKTIENFGRLTSLAQFKNTHHVGVGYFADSSVNKGELPESIPLRSIFDIIESAFRVDEGRISA